MKIPRKKNSKKFQKIFNFFFFKIFQKFFFQDFHYLVKKPLTWGCLYNLWEVPIVRIWKYICGKVIFGVPEMPPLLGVLGAWMTFKKAEMAKTLRNGLSMIEMNPLNHNWSHFVILLGLTLHQFQKKLLLSGWKQFELINLACSMPLFYYYLHWTRKSSRNSPWRWRRGNFEKWNFA